MKTLRLHLENGRVGRDVDDVDHIPTRIFYAMGESAGLWMTWTTNQLAHR